MSDYSFRHGYPGADYEPQRVFTLTSSAGRFTFPNHVQLSHAKLVRDTVTAGFRGAIPHTPRPKPENALRWFKDRVIGPVSENIEPRRKPKIPIIPLPALTFEWDNTGAVA